MANERMVRLWTAINKGHEGPGRRERGGVVKEYQSLAGVVEDPSRLGGAVTGFIERVGRCSRAGNQDLLSALLREMITFRAGEVMKWKGPSDLVYWKMLNELIREVHAAEDASPEALRRLAVQSAIMAAGLTPAAPV